MSVEFRFDRRAVLAAGAGLALSPLLSACAARAEPSRLTFTGTLEQGSLVVGRTEPGARILVDGTAIDLSPQGLFAFGFSYDQTKPALIEAHYGDGAGETRDVTPVRRQYEVQKINGLPEEFVTPPPDALERIKRENHLIVEARMRDTDGSDFASGLDWPVPGIVSGIFGSQRILDGKPMAPHLGVDIAAPAGTPIHAPADGMISIADDYYLDGGFTLIDHGHGVSTCYLHQSKRLVAAGDKVQRGQLIGLVGQTGRATGPHVHWGFNWFQVKLDPSRSTRTPAPPKG